MYYDTTNVAITGIADGGKTVFLTSLLWHLDQYPAPQASFDVKGAKKNSIELSSIRHGVLKSSNFEFDKCRSNLADDSSWPGKTHDCSSYDVEFVRPDWWVARQRLCFFDFPGERVADTAMSIHSSYADWSDDLLRHFQGNPSLASTIKPYIEAIRHGETASDFVWEYKKFLAKLTLQYEPLVSPSTFLLDQNGKRVLSKVVTDFANATYDERVALLAKAGSVGLLDESNRPIHEFCALPKEVRDACPEVVKEFEANYALYRKKIVNPLFNELFKASKLLILVDIPSLLMGGDKRFNDDRKIIFDLLEALDPDSTLGKQLYQWLPWAKPLRDVAFVASKADMVSVEDVSQGKLLSLLKQMTANAKSKMPQYRFEWFTCSACRSSWAGSRPNTLQGALAYDNPSKTKKEFFVSPLPDAWPKKFSFGDYAYYELYPEVSKAIIHPPHHSNLDVIFNYLINSSASKG